jgi:hypothetical protein
LNLTNSSSNINFLSWSNLKGSKTPAKKAHKNFDGNFVGPVLHHIRDGRAAKRLAGQLIGIAISAPVVPTPRLPAPRLIEMDI